MPTRMLDSSQIRQILSDKLEEMYGGDFVTAYSFVAKKIDGTDAKNANGYAIILGSHALPFAFEFAIKNTASAEKTASDLKHSVTDPICPRSRK